MALPIPKLNEIIDLVKKGATLEAQENIMKFREAALELQEDNIRLCEKVKELEHKLYKKENVFWEAPFYWRKDGDKKDGPFCSQCYDKAADLIRLTDHKNGVWECPTCKNIFDDGGRRGSSINVL